MILPTKHISFSHSLLGVGATLLKELSRPLSVTELWDKVRTFKGVGSYQRFILALDMLYLLGAIELQTGLLSRKVT